MEHKFRKVIFLKLMDFSLKRNLTKRTQLLDQDLRGEAILTKD